MLFTVSVMFYLWSLLDVCYSEEESRDSSEGEEPWKGWQWSELTVSFKDYLRVPRSIGRQMKPPFRRVGY